MSRPLPPRTPRRQITFTAPDYSGEASCAPPLDGQDRIAALIDRVLRMTDAPPQERYVDLLRTAQGPQAHSDLPDRFKLGVGRY